MPKRRSTASFVEFGVPVIADSVADNPGPLAGILAGMLWAERAVPGATHVLTVPGDTPFIPTDLAVRLDVAREQSAADIAVAESDGIAHPVAALWPVDLAAPLQTALGDGMRRVWDFLDRYAVSRVPFATDGFDPFFNVNTPEDLAEAERLSPDPRNEDCPLPSRRIVMQSAIRISKRDDL